MPARSRSNRRQQPARQRPRQRPADDDAVMPEAEAADIAVDAGLDIVEPPAISVMPPPDAIIPPRRSPRRPAVRPVAEAVDYTGDYEVARHDLRRITILSLLLFVAMIALSFSGLI